MTDTLNMIGASFGRLTVLSSTSARSAGSVVWACRCECGSLTTAKTKALRSGDKKSCGCLRRERNPVLTQEERKAAKRAWEQRYFSPGTLQHAKKQLRAKKRYAANSEKISAGIRNNRLKRIFGLGHMLDNPERLRAAASYLELSRKP